MSRNRKANTHESFVCFPKIARLSRNCIVTEKIDGTNAQIIVADAEYEVANWLSTVEPVAVVDGLKLIAGSRNRFLTIANDNFSFARWVADNAEELVKLGVGRHFGEWWGQKIQRTYGLEEKRFSLFNTTRFAEDRPSCCHVVPVLYNGMFTTEAVEDAVEELRTNGSKAAPGFMRPEGAVVFHEAAGVGFKKTLENDEKPKSSVEAG